MDQGQASQRHAVRIEHHHDDGTVVVLSDSAISYRSILMKLRNEGVTGELHMVDVANGMVIVREAIAGPSETPEPQGSADE
jgi:hypothetical protein